MSSWSLPCHLSKGSRSWRRADLGSTSTRTAAESAGGAWNVSWPGSKPSAGSSSAKGSARRNSVPSAAVSLSVRGSKSSRPASDSAVVSSGDVTKQCVAGLASLRAVKLRLYDVTIVFFSPFFTSCRSHWPMHGPHAFANTYTAKVPVPTLQATVPRTVSFHTNSNWVF